MKSFYKYLICFVLGIILSLILSLIFKKDLFEGVVTIPVLNLRPTRQEYEDRVKHNAGVKWIDDGCWRCGNLIPARSEEKARAVNATRRKNLVLTNADETIPEYYIFKKNNTYGHGDDWEIYNAYELTMNALETDLGCSTKGDLDDAGWISPEQVAADQETYIDDDDRCNEVGDTPNYAAPYLVNAGPRDWPHNLTGPLGLESPYRYQVGGQGESAFSAAPDMALLDNFYCSSGGGNIATSGAAGNGRHPYDGMSISVRPYGPGSGYVSTLEDIDESLVDSWGNESKWNSWLASGSTTACWQACSDDPNCVAVGTTYYYPANWRDIRDSANHGMNSMSHCKYWNNETFQELNECIPLPDNARWAVNWNHANTFRFGIKLPKLRKMCGSNYIVPENGYYREIYKVYDIDDNYQVRSGRPIDLPNENLIVRNNPAGSDPSEHIKCFKCPDGTQPKAPPMAQPGEVQDKSEQKICQPCPYPTAGENGFCNNICLTKDHPTVDLPYGALQEDGSYIYTVNGVGSEYKLGLNGEKPEPESSNPLSQTIFNNRQWNANPQRAIETNHIFQVSDKKFCVAAAHDTAGNKCDVGKISPSPSEDCSSCLPHGEWTPSDPIELRGHANLNQQKCVACPNGIYNAASQSCQKCTGNKIPNPDHSSCENCEEGQIAMNYNTVCKNPNCILPQRPGNYDLSDIDNNDLIKDNFTANNKVKCNPGYKGIPNAKPCDTYGGEIILDGCYDESNFNTKSKCGDFKDSPVDLTRKCSEINKTVLENKICDTPEKCVSLNYCCSGDIPNDIQELSSEIYYSDSFEVSNLQKDEFNSRYATVDGNIKSLQTALDSGSFSEAELNRIELKSEILDLFNSADGKYHNKEKFEENWIGGGGGQEEMASNVWERIINTINSNRSEEDKIEYTGDLSSLSEEDIKLLLINLDKPIKNDDGSFKYPTETCSDTSITDEIQCTNIPTNTWTQTGLSPLDLFLYDDPGKSNEYDPEKWIEYLNKNCYSSGTGEPVDAGYFRNDNSDSSHAGAQTLQSCKEICNNNPECNCIVHNPNVGARIIDGERVVGPPSAYDIRELVALSLGLPSPRGLSDSARNSVARSYRGYVPIKDNQLGRCFLRKNCIVDNCESLKLQESRVGRSYVNDETGAAASSSLYNTYTYDNSEGITASQLEALL